MSQCAVPVLDEYYLGITAIITVAQQFLFFLIAAGLKFDKVTDFAGCSNFVVVVLVTFLLAQSFFLRQVLVTIASLLWGFRLTGYLFYRILVTGTDERFDDKNRGFSFEFALFWFVQAVWVMVVSSPVVILNSRCVDVPMGAADWVGLAMWLIGWLIETVGDQQKFNFRQNPANKGRYCDIGLWKISRHPNYFGEIFLWWGIFITCSAVFEYEMWVSIVGPLFLTFLLFYVSGIPLLEDSADKKHGSKPEYLDYKKSTSVLIPFPPSWFRDLPPVVKLCLFFEFPLYSRVLNNRDASLETGLNNPSAIDPTGTAPKVPRPAQTPAPPAHHGATQELPSIDGRALPAAWPPAAAAGAWGAPTGGAWPLGPPGNYSSPDMGAAIYLPPVSPLGGRAYPPPHGVPPLGGSQLGGAQLGGTQPTSPGGRLPPLRAPPGMAAVTLSSGVQGHLAPKKVSPP